MTKKRRQPKPPQIEYPIATVAFYGPDDRKATKMAVGILHGGAEHVSEIKRWYADHMGDIRNDPHVTEELNAFLKTHGVKTVGGIVDRIIGCPHEEGVDYPEGQNCPMCPFWANRDRWTGDILPGNPDEEKGRTSPMLPTS